MNSEATTQPLPIFVYGTLMIGQPNDYMWQDCVQSIESASINDCRLYDFGYYPVMIRKEGGRVVGQLVRLEKECYSQIIQNLDFLEGFDYKHPDKSNFQRLRVQVSTHKGERIEAWTYVGVGRHVQNLPLIEDGDWVKHIAGKFETITGWWKEVSTVLDDARRSSDSTS